MRFNETDYTNPAQLDFVPRERRSQIWRLIIAFTVTMAIIFVIGYAPSANNHSYAPLFSMMVVGALCFYVVYRKQQNLDLVMTTEYQNLLFAQAVSLGTSFTMFVRRDGTIVYANDGLRQIFPQSTFSDSQALESVFEQGGVRKTDRERVMGAIYSNASERLVFPIKEKNGEEKEYILTIEPLARPGGFAVIRGREYRGTRTGMQLMPDVLRSTSPDKLDHMLANTPVAHYATDAFGRFEYVNPALEQMLGYEPGEIIENRLNLQHMLYQLNNQPVPDDYTLTDYTGEALFQCKQGTLAHGLLYQTLIRDQANKSIGATGSILPPATK